MAKNKDLSLIEKAKKSLASPTELFEAVKLEKGLKNAFIYLALTSFISSILSYFVTTPEYAALLASFGFPASFGIGFVLMIWVFGLVLGFLGVGLFHIFVSLLGGKQGYSNTYKAFSYGGTPAALFGWIPFIGIVFSLWSLYLEIKGISILQNMSMGRAAAAILIPVAIIVVIVFIFAFAMVASIMGTSATLMP